MHPAAASIPFTPPQDQISPLLAALADPQLSLAAVAERFQTTAAALGAWLSLPAAQPHLDTFASALAGRARLAAMSVLPAAVHAALQIVQGHKALPMNSQQSGLSTYDFHAAAEHRRNSQCRRLAVWLLYKISCFSAHPFLKPPRPAAESSPPQSAPARSTSAATPIPTAPTMRAPSMPAPRIPAPGMPTPGMAAIPQPTQRQTSRPTSRPLPQPTSTTSGTSPMAINPIASPSLEAQEPLEPLLQSRGSATARLALAAGAHPFTPHTRSKPAARPQLRLSTPRAP